MAHHGHHGSDKGAAYVGLVGGVVFIFAVCFAIVKLTNSHFAEKGAQTAPAAAAH